MAGRSDKPDIQGEGNYTAAREFDKEQRAFAERGSVEKAAREAEQALDGPQGKDLERARRESAAGDPRKAGKTPKDKDGHDWAADPRQGGTS